MTNEKKSDGEQGEQGAKRKSEGEQGEQEAKVRVLEEERRGEKRETEVQEWDEYQARPQRRWEERRRNLEKPANDPPQDEVMKEIAQVSLSESDVTFLSNFDNLVAMERPHAQ